MGLFDKKNCDICGGKIGLLGNRKLEDGNLCKDCAKNLSPWFDERRHSTVAQIRDQLSYREENKQAVRNFHITRSFGQSSMLYFDENSGKFMICQTKNTEEENPDVLDFSQVTGCELDVKESRTEETREVRESDGKTRRVSYNPPRYTYHYDFYVIIRVDHPYFDEMKFKLNRNTVVVRSTDNGYANNRYRQNNVDLAGSIVNGLNAALNRNGMNNGYNNGYNNGFNNRMTTDYDIFYNMGMEIKEALMGARSQGRQDAYNAPAQNDYGAPMQNGYSASVQGGYGAPMQNNYDASVQGGGPVTCPFCGAVTTPDAAGNCEFCGASII